MKDKLTPAVGYIRMSTDRQEHSPQRQRAEIKKLAEQQGYRIVKWYEDHGLTGTESLNRPEFQQLLKDAAQGRFEAILVHEQSRFSREDVFDAMLHWRVLRQAGVDIVTCQRGRLRFDDLGGIITAIVDQHGAREESVKLAQRVVSGQKLRSKEGKRIGGIVFGYDREVLDETGKVVRRVHFRDRFRKPVTWTTRLVPSDDRAAVEAVKWAYNAIRRGLSIGAIARELNKRGLKTVWGNWFDFSSVSGILTNPTYTGAIQAGRHSRGKFCSLADEGIIVVEDAHEAIIPLHIFEEVARILAGRKRHYQPRTQYLLSQMVTCFHCGQNMTGVHRQVGSESPRKERYYLCDRGKHLKHRFGPCPHPSVRIEKIESFVLEAIRKHLLDKGAEDKIRQAIIRARSRSASDTSQDEKRLREIQRRIERGTENLALASKQDFVAISNVLTKWREEEAEIKERIDRRRDTLEPLPEALEIIRKYGFVKGKLNAGDRIKLQYALRQAVASIRIGTRMATTGDLTYREHFGELRFHEAFLGDKVIPIPDEVVGQRKIWREISELVRQANSPLHLKDFCRHIGTKDMSRAAHHVRKAEQAGLMRKLPGYGGWVK